MTAINQTQPLRVVSAGMASKSASRLATGPIRTVKTPRVQPGLEQRHLWERRYRWRVHLTDALIVVASVVSVAVLQLTLFPSNVLIADPWMLVRVAVLTGAVWLVMLSVFQTRASNIAGAGSVEYKRVAHASGFAFGFLSILFIVFQWPGLRAQLLTVPLCIVALLFGRWMWRKWLLRQRTFGHYASRTLVVGAAHEVEYVIGRLDQEAKNAHIIVGIALDDSTIGEVRVNGRRYARSGDVSAAAHLARELRADTIIVASTPSDDPDYIKRLSWGIEGTASELILASRLVDVAGPRISLRPVDGLPLISVKIPRFEGGRHLVKRGMDILLASFALLAIGLVAPLIALAIVVDSRGPVFFRQVRIGRDGREFRMLKFRSMKTTAEQELAALLEDNEGAGPLFKMKNDPRITRVGRILRKFSIDELPQFWNVLVGDMSIVGPRPPLPSEVREYDGAVYRRLYINPGITGLWQVSGRSDLSWEESVKLDLRYVENWSVTEDLRIMWRTARVMVAPSGAY